MITNSKITKPDDEAGFTLIELIFVIAGIALLLGIIVPNLSALVPSTRLDGSAKAILTELSMIRSEARIQAKRMELEFDLDKGRFRTILPPEEQLMSDQVVYNDAEFSDNEHMWTDLNTGVKFYGAGDAKSGIVDSGKYRLIFDEYGFTADQVIAIQLENDDQMIWSVSIRGLTGKTEIHPSEDGQVLEPEEVNEASF